MDLQGNLENFGLPEIFQLLAASQKTGTLGIQKGEEVAMVYFREGQVFYAYGPRKMTRLGDLLVKSGRLSAEQLETALAEKNRDQGHRRLGEILLAKQWLSHDDLEAAVQHQVEEVIYEALRWDDGMFKFYEEQFPTDEEITITISTENLILEGVRRLDELSRIKGNLPPFEHVLHLAPAEDGRKKDIALAAEEWNVLTLVDGTRNIYEILEAAGADRLSTLRTLAGLHSAGLVAETEAPPEALSDRLVAMGDRLSELLESYLSEDKARV
jgi:hypothetical protein